MIKITTLYKIILCLFMGILMHFAWTLPWLFWVNFVALIPLLDKDSRYWMSFIFFGAWYVMEMNGLFNTGYYLKISLLILFLILISSTPFLIYGILRNWKMKIRYTLIAFFIVYMTKEFLLNIPGCFPMFNLGYQLSNVPELIQWYEYTSYLGGSAFVLLMNIAFFQLRKKYGWGILAVGIALCCCSLYRFHQEEMVSKKAMIGVIHDNLDCKNVKYNQNEDFFVNRYKGVINEAKDLDLDFIVFPETAYPYAGAIENLVLPDRNYQTFCPNTYCELVIGAILRDNDEQKYKREPQNWDPYTRSHYQLYNAALEFDCANSDMAISVKNTLVPFNETVPYLFRKFSKANRFGGPFRFARNWDYDHLHRHDSLDLHYDVSICYESLFYHGVKESVNNGAELIFVILNEGWYIDENIAKRFLCASRCRALENRVPVVRSSNYGYSSFIKPNGTIKFVTNVEGLHVNSINISL